MADICYASGKVFRTALDFRGFRTAWKAGIPLSLATSASQRCAKRAHYSLDSRPCSSQGQALRGNGEVGAREWRMGLYSLDARGVLAQIASPE